MIYQQRANGNYEAWAMRIKLYVYIATWHWFKHDFGKIHYIVYIYIYIPYYVHINMSFFVVLLLYNSFYSDLHDLFFAIPQVSNGKSWNRGASEATLKDMRKIDHELTFKMYLLLQCDWLGWTSTWRQSGDTLQWGMGNSLWWSFLRCRCHSRMLAARLL